MDVLGFEQVEDGFLIAVPGAGEVEMRVAGMVAELGCRNRLTQSNFHVARRAGGQLRAERLRPVLEALPDLDADRSGRDLDGYFAPGVEEPAEVTVRRLASAVAL